MIRKSNVGEPVRRTGDDRNSGGSGYSGNGLPSSSRGLSPAERDALLNSQNGNTSLGSIDMGNIGKPGAPILSYVDLINALSSVDPYFAQLAHLVTGGSDPTQYDWNKELLDTMLQLYLTKENRQYNEGIRDEQRIFDSPTNQLARLMGAGIGRDAAIQMISGSGSGSGSSSIFSDPASVQTAIPASESFNNAAQADLAKTQQGLGIASSVMQGISVVSGLVGLGFSSAQAFQQLNVMKNNAYLTDQQRKAYDAASGAFTIINSAGIENSSEVFGSIDATAKTILSLANSGNSAAKSFVDSGGIDQLRNTSPYSAPFLNQLYKNERDSSDYGALMTKRFRAMDLDNGLKEVTIDKGHVEVESMYKQLLMQNEQLRLLDQQFRKGEIDIKIAGETLKSAEYQNVFDKYQSEAYQNAMENGLDGSVSGKQMLSESTWRELYGHWRKLGVEQSEENYAEYEKFLQNNFDASCFLATIKAASYGQLADAWTANETNPQGGFDVSNIWTRFTNIFFGTKTDQIIQLGEGAAEVGVDFYLGTHHKNFRP